eukprot:ctg_1176.g447
MLSSRRRYTGHDIQQPSKRLQRHQRGADGAHQRHGDGGEGQRLALVAHGGGAESVRRCAHGHAARHGHLGAAVAAVAHHPVEVALAEIGAQQSGQHHHGGGEGGVAAEHARYGHGQRGSDGARHQCDARGGGQAEQARQQGGAQQARAEASRQPPSTGR